LTLRPDTPSASVWAAQSMQRRSGGHQFGCKESVKRWLDSVCHGRDDEAVHARGTADVHFELDAIERFEVNQRV